MYLYVAVSAGSCALAASLPLAGFCTNTPSPFVSPYVNVEVSCGDGALVRKFAFSGECASG